MCIFIQRQHRDDFSKMHLCMLTADFFIVHRYISKLVLLSSFNPRRCTVSQNIHIVLHSLNTTLQKLCYLSVSTNSYTTEIVDKNQS